MSATSAKPPRYGVIGLVLVVAGTLVGYISPALQMAVFGAAILCLSLAAQTAARARGKEGQIAVIRLVGTLLAMLFWLSALLIAAGQI